MRRGATNGTSPGGMAGGSPSSIGRPPAPDGSSTVVGAARIAGAPAVDPANLTRRVASRRGAISGRGARERFTAGGRLIRLDVASESVSDRCAGLVEGSGVVAENEGSVAHEEVGLQLEGELRRVFGGIE
jgi:hypothetical protein